MMSLPPEKLIVDGRDKRRVISHMTTTPTLQEELRQAAKRKREELREVMEEHEEVHSEVRWRRVCAIFEDHPVWKSVPAEERKDVFEDVIFSLAKKEKVHTVRGSDCSVIGPKCSDIDRIKCCILALFVAVKCIFPVL